MKATTTQGFRLRSILIHSLWMTAAGLLLFRLATANTQKHPLYVSLFSISGAALATAPWLVQVLMSTAIMVLYNAGVHDFTWLVRSPLEEGRREVDQDIERGLVFRNGRIRIWNGFGFKVEGGNGPKLLRNRTV